MTLKALRTRIMVSRGLDGRAEAITGLAHLRVVEDAERTGFRLSTGVACWLVVTLYLFGAIAVNWHLWANPGRVQVVPGNEVSRDIDLFAWCMRHAATAIARGRLPALVTPDLNAPVGLNLMWNTSFLLPATLFAPLTLLAGPQASLNVLLTLGFAGTATTAFWVLRRWGTSVPAAALGGAVFGFSPALRIAAVGHNHLQFAVLVPLIADALLRLLTGCNGLPASEVGSRTPVRPVRTGALLGLLLAAQLFIAEETVAMLGVAASVLVVVLAASRARAVLARIRPVAAGLAAAVGVLLVLCGYGLWEQFHGPLTEHGSPWTTSDFYNRVGDFVNAPSGMLFPSQSTVRLPQQPAGQDGRILRLSRLAATRCPARRRNRVLARPAGADHGGDVRGAAAIQPGRTCRRPWRDFSSCPAPLALPASAPPARPAPAEPVLAAG